MLLLNQQNRSLINGQADFNTSYVVIKLQYKIKLLQHILDFNTSYVVIKPEISESEETL